jgi:hypothetical protein
MKLGRLPNYTRTNDLKSPNFTSLAPMIAQESGVWPKSLGTVGNRCRPGVLRGHAVQMSALTLHVDYAPPPLGHAPFVPHALVEPYPRHSQIVAICCHSNCISFGPQQQHVRPNILHKPQWLKFLQVSQQPLHEVPCLPCVLHSLSRCTVDQRCFKKSGDITCCCRVYPAAVVGSAGGRRLW